LDASGNPIVEEITQEEESLLKGIRRCLLEVPVVTGATDRDVIAELERLRQEMIHAKGEDRGSILQQYDQQYALLQQLRKGRSEETIDPDSPYFAHIRLVEGERTRDLFLGRTTRLDQGLRILDWRNAPIARIFYRYTEGDEYTEEMGGRIFEGVVGARRTVSIAQGKLNRIEATQGVMIRQKDDSWQLEAKRRPRLLGVAEGALVSGTVESGRLGGGGGRVRADKHLPDIAALIDPDQFALISGPDSGLVVLRGGAGSGKTTVALHRVAWLAFQDPKRFRPSRIAVVVWGKALRTYISRVLPSLGVSGVEVVTWPDLSQDLFRRVFSFLPKDRAVNTPEVVTRIKLHAATPAILKAWVEQNPAGNNVRTALDDAFRIFGDPRWLGAELADRAPGAFTEDELKKVADWTQVQERRLMNWVEGEREDGAELDEEDEALLLRLYQLRVGPLKRRGRPVAFAHLVVDEVQDLAPLEVAVLLDLSDKHGCVTLAGDTRQHVLEDTGFDAWDDLLDGLDGSGVELSNLEIGYRSTARITAFAHRVLGPLAEGEPPRVATADGEPVELFEFTDHGAAVAFLGEALHGLSVEEPLASVAVIARHGGLASLYFQGLQRADVPRLRRVVDGEFAFEPGIEVTEVSEVKGLEFDYVVLVEVSAACYPESDHSRRLMHVAATRARHQLWLTVVGSRSPLLSGE